MKKIHALLLLPLFLLSAKISAQAFFQKTYSHPGFGYESGYAVIATSDGGYLMGGSTAAGQLGSMQIYLVKTDANGAVQWSKSYGGAIADYVADMLQNPDGTYMLVGTTYSYNTQPYGNMYVQKLDANGNSLWSKHYGYSGYDFGYSIKATSDGGYVIGGLTSSIGAGNYDYYVLKIDASGTSQWGKSIGGFANDEGFSIAVLADGSFLIAGQSNSFPPPQMVYPYQMLLCKLSPTGTVLWSRTYSAGSGNCICQKMIGTSDGGCLLAGWTDSFGAGQDDIYVVKTDSAGGLQWSNSFGGDSMEVLFGVSESPNGGYALAGYTQSFGAGGQDYFLATLDANGNYLWATCYGGAENERCNAVVATSDGGYLLTGVAESFASGNYTELYLVKTDGSGYSGCNENDALFTQFTPNTIVDTITPTVNATPLYATACVPGSGSGAAVNSLCFSMDVAELAVNSTLQLVPNPAASEVQLSSESTIEQVEITDALGQLLFRKEKCDAAVLRFDVSEWKSGVYFVRVRVDGAWEMKRLVVM